MKFTLEIELGNDGMQTSEDVTRVLHKIAERVEAATFDYPEGPYKIRDANGNTVGNWAVVAD